MSDKMDELAVQRFKAKARNPEIESILADAVDAWLTYQEARHKLGVIASEMFREGFQLAEATDVEAVAAVEKIAGASLDAIYSSVIESGRVIEAIIDDMVIPAVEAAEAQLASDAEEADGVCRHERARIDDGAPEDAVVVPCAIVELFGVQTGDLVDDITCPGCSGVLKFRIWRPKETKWAVDRQDVTSLEGDAIGPWLECVACGGWSTLAYKVG